MLGTLKVNPHCAVHGTEYDLGASRVSQMGLTSNEKNVLNQVSKELNKASKMHKSQADRIRSLGFAPKPKNLVQNYEPTNQDMTWFKGRVKTLHNELHSEKMSQIHNLGSARRVQMIGNTDNIQFVAIEVVKFTAILLGGGLLLSVPAYMLVNNKKLKTSNKSESEKLAHALITQPVKTSAWWAGGSSVLIGAKDNNPKQMAAGAGLMAFSSAIPSVKLQLSRKI